MLTSHSHSFVVLLTLTQTPQDATAKTALTALLTRLEGQSVSQSALSALFSYNTVQ